MTQTDVLMQAGSPLPQETRDWLDCVRAKDLSDVEAGELNEGVSAFKLDSSRVPVEVWTLIVKEASVAGAEDDEFDFSGKFGWSQALSVLVSLCLVSHQFYTISAPILYSYIQVDHALGQEIRSFSRSFTSNAALVAYVKKISWSCISAVAEGTNGSEQQEMDSRVLLRRFTKLKSLQIQASPHTDGPWSADVLRDLPFLDSLTLLLIPWSTSTKIAMAQLLSMLPNLTSLSITYMIVTNVADLNDLALPELNELTKLINFSVQGTTFSGQYYMIGLGSTLYNSLKSLVRLHISLANPSGFQLMYFNDEIPASLRFPAVKVLSIGTLHDASLTAFDWVKFLNRFPLLEHLQLEAAPTPLKVVMEALGEVQVAKQLITIELVVQAPFQSDFSSTLFESSAFQSLKKVIVTTQMLKQRDVVVPEGLITSLHQFCTMAEILLSNAIARMLEDITEDAEEDEEARRLYVEFRVKRDGDLWYRADSENQTFRWANAVNKDDYLEDFLEDYDDNMI